MNNIYTNFEEYSNYDDILQIPFKENEKENYFLLKDLENCHILEVNQLLNNIEIIYTKNDKTKYLVITYHSLYNHFSKAVYNHFQLSNEPLDDKIMDGTDFIYDNTETYYHKERYSQLEQLTFIKQIGYFSHFDDKQQMIKNESIVFLTEDEKEYHLLFKDLGDEYGYNELICLQRR